MNLEKAKEILKEYFGYDTLRVGQDKIIENILSNKDVVGIMPTGAGKSICFQIPAMILEGITIVISPLISLMKDQVNSLTQVGIKAAYLNSSLTEKQYFTVLDNIRNGIYKIIYVAPERLLVNGFLETLKNLKISMITIDEAHCISQWGQDFRPSYMQIVDFIGKFPERPIISAFTATATSLVKDDIINILNLHNPYVLVTGFDRSNLYFEIQKPNDKYKALEDFLKDKKEESGIIYCSTRDNVENVCKYLNENGYEATRYHAGLSDKERRENQEDFIYDRSRIMVATNAFGMGIDKSNVTFVVHFNMPKDIESYYQEAGRAGRDGSEAHCLLLYSGQDVRTNLYMIENSKDRSYESIDSERELKARDRERLKIMSNYCHTSTCLRQYIINYFGEEVRDSCDNCSNCKTEFEEIDITVQAQKIISCVIKTRERFGTNMIIDILRGSKNKRILNLGLDKISTYNIMAETDAFSKEVVNFLILNNYLYTTNDEFPILKLGKFAGRFLKEKEAISMKVVKFNKAITNETPIDKKISSKSKYKKTVDLHSVDANLLSSLKTLRLALATEQKVPAFLIFSDSTLIDMCIKMPQTEEEFLEVSGVGKQKLERYGAKFLELITSKKELGIIENNQNENDKLTADEIKTDFSEIKIFEEPVTISTIADQINVVIMQQGRKITAIKLNNWLVEEGYLEIIEEDENKRKSPTSKGEELGITSVEKKNFKEQSYYTNYFSKNAQKFIIDNFDELI